MKKRILILTALTLLVVGVLCGCGCSKESKFTGTWEEKIDEEKLKVEEEKQAETLYGKAETENDKKLLGKWETDDKIRNFTINKRNGIVEIPGVPYFTIVDENGNEIYAKKATGRTYFPEYNYVYDTKNNTLTIQERQVGAFSESTKTLVYKKAQAKSPKDNFKPDKLVLNSNKTGTGKQNTEHCGTYDRNRRPP